MSDLVKAVSILLSFFYGVGISTYGIVMAAGWVGGPTRDTFVALVFVALGWLLLDTSALRTKAEQERSP